MDIPLILFTGLRHSGTSTRVAALQLALRHDNGFKGYRVEPDGMPMARRQGADEIELFSLMCANGMAGSLDPFSANCHFRIEAGSYSNQVEVWERSYADALPALINENIKYAGVVISIPIHAAGREWESDLDALLRPLRTKYWIEFKHDRIPWIILDLTQYDMLFSQVVPEMLAGGRVNEPRAATTPYSLAARNEIRKAAVRSFAQQWLGDNELTHLVNAERQRCSLAGRHAINARRVMVQVSSAWGFLAGRSGPGARHPANCRHPAETSEGVACARFPRFTEEQKRLLRTLKSQIAAHHSWGAGDERKAIEATAERFMQVWRPIGIVEPLPSVVWKRPAPAMFWAPEIMSAGSAGQRTE